MHSFFCLLNLLLIVVLAEGCGPVKAMSNNVADNYQKYQHDTLRLYERENIKSKEADLEFPRGMKHVLVEPSNDRYKFLHDPVIVRHRKELIAAWYNCPEAEIVDESCIRARRSADGGKTWSAPEVVAEDKEGEGVYYVPVQMLSFQDKLYGFVGKMTGHDRIVSTLLYKYNENEKTWGKVGEVAKLFLPNTSPTKLKNGNWIIAGRVATSLGALPLIPAVLISDGDKLEKPWRIVQLQDDEFVKGLQHPETTIIEKDNVIYAFTRVNGPGFRPVIYISSDYGETWTKIIKHDFNAVSSKMYAGKLSTGQGYIVFNYPVYEKEGKGLQGRSTLAIAVSKDNKDPFVFSKIYKIQSPGHESPSISHYPTALESDDKLYVIYTAHFDSEKKRQCELAIIPLESLK